MNGISLKELVPQEKDLANKLTWVEFKGVQFQIRYVSRATLLSLVEGCMVAAYDPKQKGRGRTLDADRFVEQIATTIVKDWRNCTIKNLVNLMPINTEGLTDEELDTPIPFNTENLLMVIKNVHELDNFLQECATDASVFRGSAESELAKNSLSSQSGT